MSEIDYGTASWIHSFENSWNTNHTVRIPDALDGHKPYWYSLSPKSVNIATTLNPYKRFFFIYSYEPFMVDQRFIGIQVREGYDVELIAALLNSAITFLILELRGTPRNLGVLDLNANYLKQLHFLNPSLLTENAKTAIIEAFQPLKGRRIYEIQEEILNSDRRHFDEVILQSFGFDTALVDLIYNLLTESVEIRTSLSKQIDKS